MTGGVAFVCETQETLAARTQPQQVSVEPLSAADQQHVHALLEAHERLTGSRVARMLLRRDRGLSGFWRVGPAVPVAEGVAEVAEPVAQAVNQ
jgi:glutamate synthase domain-containing protein 3